MAKPPRPTESEFEILKVLWTQGACTVQQVHDVLGKSRGIGYTTVLKVLQIMLTKGLVRRDESQRQHIYAAAVTEASTRRSLVREFVDRVFSGSAESLVLHALAGRKTSPEELRQIRKLLDELEEKSK